MWPSSGPSTTTRSRFTSSGSTSPPSCSASWRPGSITPATRRGSHPAALPSSMPHVPGLRSCYAKVGRLVYFGRMLDKIRLQAAGRLPPEYQANVGDAQFFVLDGRCCRFLGVMHAALRERTLAGGTDEEILAWVHARGTARTDA